MAVFRPVATFLSDAGSLNDLQDQNARLRIENEELRNRVSELEQDTQRLKELESALGVTQGDTKRQLLAANVTHRDASPFTEVVSIDRGAADGIKNGMVVLSARGTLLGTVTEVFADRSFIRLITDSRSKVNAQVLESQSDGLVRGTPNRGLSFDLAQGDIKVGDTVITSGLGGNYPQGIPIGRVSEVSGTAQDLFRKVKVEPGVRLSTAQTVLVLLSFTPQRIEVGE